MSDRKIALRKELREARGWMTDTQIAEVVVRCAAIDEICPSDLRAVLAEFRSERDGRRRFAVVDVDERHARAVRICELWAQGVPELEITGLVDMSEGGFRSEKQRLRKAGYDLPLRATGGTNASLTAVQAAEIREAKRGGRSVVELALSFGVSESTVYAVLRGGPQARVAA